MCIAGAQPKGVHPVAVGVMAEAGIDLASHPSDHLDNHLDKESDPVSTGCDATREACTVFPRSVRQVHHGFEDPGQAGPDEDELLSVFGRIRGKIETCRRQLMAEESGAD